MNRPLVMLAAAGTALAMLACGGAGSTSGQATGAPIPVGFIGALSGDGADYGTSSLNAAQLRVKEINDSGGIDGRPIKIIPIDDQTKPATAVDAAQQLVLRDHVVAILGPGQSGNVLAVEKFTNAQKVPILETGTVDAIISPDYPYVWRSAGPVSSQLAYLNRVVFQKYKRIAIIHDSLGFGSESDKLLRGQMSQAGIEPVDDESYSAGAIDMTPQVIRIKQANPDVVYWFGTGGDAGTVRKTMNTLGMTSVPMLGNNGVFPSALKIAGAALNGYVYPDDVDPCKKQLNDLLAKYYKTYKVDIVAPHSVAEYYDAVSLLAAGLKKSHGAGGEKLNQAFESGVAVDGADGASPGASWSKNKHNSLAEDGSQNRLWVIEDGKYLPFPTNACQK